MHPLDKIQRQNYENCPVKPFYKLGDKVRVLPLNPESEKYADQKYGQNTIGTIIAIDDKAHTYFTYTDDFYKSVRYKIKTKSNVTYVFESMIAPVDVTPLDEVNEVVDGVEVYRPIGQHQGQNLYCVYENEFLTTKSFD